MKKIISLLLVVSVVMSFCVIANAASEELGPNDVYVYDINSTRGVQNLSNDTTGLLVNAGQFFRVDKPFVEIAYSCASWYDSIGNITVTLYSWKGDYDKTIASEPLAQKEWVNFEDNSFVTLNAEDGKCFNEGEYLCTLTNGTQRVCVRTRQRVNPTADIMQQSYINGEPTHIVFESQFTYYTGNNIIAEDHENIIMSVKSSKVFVEGESSYLDVAPKVINGRTLVPVRFVAEKLGAVVEYSVEDRAVSIEKDDLTITLTIGDNKMYVNGIVEYLESPAILTNGRTLVPIRAVAEALGNKVKYFDSGIIVIGRIANIFNPLRAAAFEKLF